MENNIDDYATVINLVDESESGNLWFDTRSPQCAADLYNYIINNIDLGREVKMVLSKIPAEELAADFLEG